MAVLNSHAKDDIRMFDEASKRFDRVYGYLKSMDEKSDKRDEKRDSQFDTLAAEVAVMRDRDNRQDGAVGLGKWIFGGAGMVAIAVLTWGLGHFKP